MLALPERCAVTAVLKPTLGSLLALTVAEVFAGKDRLAGQKVVVWGRCGLRMTGASARQATAVASPRNARPLR